MYLLFCVTTSLLCLFKIEEAYMSILTVVYTGLSLFLYLFFLFQYITKVHELGSYFEQLPYALTVSN
jgi:hypothetical protein